MNGVIEKARKKTEVSIAVAADAIGIPRMLIDIRHGKQLQLFNYNVEILYNFFFFLTWRYYYMCTNFIFHFWL